MRVNDLIAGVKSDVAIKVYGDDLATMADAADQIRRAVAEVRGAADVKMEIPFGLPSIRVKVNRESLGRVGASPDAVLDAVAMTRAGMPAGLVREGERVFDLIVRLGGEEVQTHRDLARLPISTTSGNLVPMAMV